VKRRKKYVNRRVNFVLKRINKISALNLKVNHLKRTKNTNSRGR